MVSSRRSEARLGSRAERYTIEAPPVNPTTRTIRLTAALNRAISPRNSTPNQRAVRTSSRNCRADPEPLSIRTAKALEIGFMPGEQRSGFGRRAILERRDARERIHDEERVTDRAQPLRERLVRVAGRGEGLLIELEDQDGMKAG